MFEKKKCNYRGQNEKEKHMNSVHIFLLKIQTSALLFMRLIDLCLSAGAVVKLQCNNTKKGPWEEEAKTDGQGQFVVRPRKVSTWGIHKCKLFMVSSPNADCYTPRFDGPWKLGFPLTAVNTTTSPPADLQYYTTSQPLLYYYYWPDCY